MPTVILGGGIIALSTAYYLSLASSERIYILESTPTLFASCSGFAAGFLARDWFVPSVCALGELSFRLHAELAREHDGETQWGYSASTGISLSAVEHGDARGTDWLLEGTSRVSVARRAGGATGVPGWLQGVGEVEVVSAGETTAQVEPRRLCEWLLERCLARGVEVRNPVRAVGVDVEDGVLVGVRVTGGEVVKCDKIVVACGAWSSAVFEELFPEAGVRLPVGALAGHSVVLRSPRWKGGEECHAVFTVSADGWSPELFSRRGGDMYLAGLNSRVIPLPELASAAEVRPEDVEVMVKAAKELLGEDVEVVGAAVCFRPVTGSGRPIVGKVPGEDVGLVEGPGGVWVATGHGPWGIALSLGTGKVMAEMMRGGETEVDVGGLGVWE